MDTRRTRWWGLLSLATSLVVHLCVLLWLLNAAATFTLSSWKPESTSRLIWLEPLPPPVATPKPIALPPQPRRGERLVAPPPPPQSLNQPEAVPPRESDIPRVAVLTPRDEGAPRTQQPLIDEHERVSSLVDSWLSVEVNGARVRGGLVDPAYAQLCEALRAATDDAPRFIDTNSPIAVGSALVESWGAGAAKYGKSGAPYAEPGGRLERIERPPSLDALAKVSPEDAQAMAQFLAAGARLQEFADGRPGFGLSALVELRHRPSGALESARLLQPSGLAPFDSWVLERARQVALEFALDGGTLARPLHSVWRFDGVVLYRRKLSSLDGGVARAAVGMITMAALSALSGLNHSTRDPGDLGRPLGPRMPGMTGRFDEKGSLDLVDLTNPTYNCTVRLIEAD